MVRHYLWQVIDMLDKIHPVLCVSSDTHDLIQSHLSPLGGEVMPSDYQNTALHAMRVVGKSASPVL